MKTNRSTHQALILICFCLFAACHHQHHDQYKRFSITYYRHGQLWSGILKEPAMVQSYPCTGRVSFDSAGSINHFTLSRDHEILGHMIPEYSIVDIYDKDMAISLSRPTEIQGYLVPGGKYIYTPFSLDKSGNLIFFIPEENMVIDGIPCMGQRVVRLYPDGELWVCFLSREFEINGTLYPSGIQLLFDENGKAQEYSYELYEVIRKDLNL